MAYFETVEAEWLELDAAAGIGIVIDPWECHAQGCVVSVRAGDPAELERFSRLAINARSAQAWPGASFRSGFIRDPAGDIEATWVFFTPGADSSLPDTETTL